MNNRYIQTDASFRFGEKGVASTPSGVEVGKPTKHAGLGEYKLWLGRGCIREEFKQFLMHFRLVLYLFLSMN